MNQIINGKSNCHGASVSTAFNTTANFICHLCGNACDIVYDNPSTTNFALAQKITDRFFAAGAEVSKQDYDFVRGLLEDQEGVEREKIATDIKSVLAMLDGETDRKLIANYIRKYLLKT